MHEWLLLLNVNFFLNNIIVGEGQARPVRLVSTGWSFSMKIELPLRKKHEVPDAVVEC